MNNLALDTGCFAESPTAPVVRKPGDISLLVAEEAYTGASVADTLAFHAAARPDQTVFNFIDYSRELPQDRAISYAELTVRARQVAALLQQSCRAGDRILLLYPSGIEYLCAFFGCLIAGMIAVPAYPPINPRLRMRLAAVAEDSGASAALTLETTISQMGELSDLTEPLKRLRWLATDVGLAGLESGAAEADLSPQSVAFLQYTSGSTGTPKGVIVTHGNLLNNLRLIAQHMRFGPDDRHLSWLPPYHDMGMVGATLGSFAAGVPLDFMMPTAFLRKPERWLTEISRRGSTLSGAPNFAYELCLSRMDEETAATLDLSSWQVAYSGAEPVRKETLQRFAQRFARAGFDPKAFYPCYGMAETTLYASGVARGAGAAVLDVDAEIYANEKRAQPAADARTGRSVVSCGVPADGHVVAIVDPASEEPLADGQVGEVMIQGPSITAGYWKREQETEACFGARIDGRQGRFLRTGDLGFMLNGELYVSGRVKDLIIVRGVNLYPHDIEATVDYCHDAIRQGCGIAFSIEKDSEEHIVFVQEVGRNDVERAQDIFNAVHRAIVAQHEVQPWAIVLIEQGSIPKTTSGKLSRRPCKQQYLEGELKQLAAWSNPFYLPQTLKNPAL